MGAADTILSYKSKLPKEGQTLLNLLERKLEIKITEEVNAKGQENTDSKSSLNVPAFLAGKDNWNLTMERKTRKGYFSCG